MLTNLFREIPTYPTYAVTSNGVIKSMVTDTIVSQHLLNGYMVIDAAGGSPTTTLPVHRAVALAWVANTDVSNKRYVNHIDGMPLNNNHLNLEWVTCSENNYHAVNTGLRLDNIPCTVHDTFDDSVTSFMSIAQASEYMGLRKCTPYSMLRPKKHGAVIAGRYEFRLVGDDEPWFYGSNSPKIKPTRYRVIATDLFSGETDVIYTTRDLLRKHQLYDSASYAIPALVSHANYKYDDFLYELDDSYRKETYSVNRDIASHRQIKVVATCKETTLHFDSLSTCSKYFKIDRSTIQCRLNNGKTFNEWVFNTVATTGGNP